MLVLLAKIARSLRSLPEASVSRGVKSVFNKFRRIFRDTVNGREKRRGGWGNKQNAISVLLLTEKENCQAENGRRRRGHKQQNGRVKCHGDDIRAE